jgi:hypothetical protein
MFFLPTFFSFCIPRGCALLGDNPRKKEHEIMKTLSCALLAFWLMIPTLTWGAGMQYSYDNLGRLSMAEYSCVRLGYSYDTVDNILTKNIDTLSTNKGDVDSNNVVDLIDAILSLQVVAGLVPSKMISANCEVDHDNKIGLSEAIFVMQKIAGLAE